MDLDNLLWRQKQPKPLDSSFAAEKSLLSTDIEKIVLWNLTIVRSPEDFCTSVRVGASAVFVCVEIDIISNERENRLESLISNTWQQSHAFEAASDDSVCSHFVVSIFETNLKEKKKNIVSSKFWVVFEQIWTRPCRAEQPTTSSNVAATTCNNLSLCLLFY